MAMREEKIAAIKENDKKGTKFTAGQRRCSPLTGKRRRSPEEGEVAEEREEKEC